MPPACDHFHEILPPARVLALVRDNLRATLRTCGRPGEPAARELRCQSLLIRQQADLIDQYMAQLAEMD